MRLIEPSNAVVMALFASGLLIVGAHLFERVGGMPPCLLCLDQREAHWAAIAGAAMTLGLVAAFGKVDRILAAALGAICLLYVFSTGLAGYHAGVEWGLWEGPKQCSAVGNIDTTAISAGDFLSELERPAEGPSCSEAAWRMLGISMAGYNALISLALALITGFSCMRIARGLRHDRLTGPAVSEGSHG